ncbi:MAG: DNA alkylation repair protein [Caldisericales bacterium]|nr:DNA alkylation repair protein [Caldisericia bacterium]MCE5176945.1 DNA alkylation repair protein [bacterium]NMD14475.1 DNA alkylation repair protein [Caldisericales bacterium]
MASKNQKENTFSVEEAIKILSSAGKKENREGMAKFGINTEKAFGVSVVRIREIAKMVGKGHEKAQKLWETGFHEARIMACLIDNPKMVTREQAENWALEFNSWDLCDQCCMNLLDRLPFSYELAAEWAKREEEYIKRAGFAIMASLALHDKKAPDEKFLQFLDLIDKQSTDPRNFVKKAINWALRQIGKRRPGIMDKVEILAKKLAESDDKNARWVGKDALRGFEKKNLSVKKD